MCVVLYIQDVVTKVSRKKKDKAKSSRKSYRKSRKRKDGMISIYTCPCIVGGLVCSTVN